MHEVLYRAIRDQYYRTGDGFLCVYAITLQSSFEDVTEFHDAILRVKDCDTIPFVLVGVRVVLCCALVFRVVVPASVRGVFVCVAGLGLI